VEVRVGVFELFVVVVLLVLWGVVVMVGIAVLVFSSSVDGGGGRGERTEARHRKHSPVPKYFGAGCGWSER
jgi:hypothetical protein